MLEGNSGCDFLTILNPCSDSKTDWQWVAHIFSNVWVGLYLEAKLCSSALQEEIEHYLDREHLKVKYDLSC